MEEKILALGLTLPPAPQSGGIYHPIVISGNLLFISGQVPVQNDGTLIVGKVGDELSMEEGKSAARQVGLTMLATLKEELGELGRIKNLIKTLGMVNCTPEFSQQPQVINGFSELFVEILGEENGKGARSAVGMTLPGQIAVEIEAIFELM